MSSPYLPTYILYMYYSTLDKELVQSSAVQYGVQSRLAPGGSRYLPTYVVSLSRLPGLSLSTEYVYVYIYLVDPDISNMRL